MFKTKITDLLNIEYPIVGGTMMHLSKADLVAAVSDAGALGIMASANYLDKESFRKDVKKVQHQKALCRQSEHVPLDAKNRQP